jgi:CTP:molybdopterin cytidylyltransferase MocA
VTGHARHAVEEQVRSFTVTLAHNEAPASGQEGSVRVGLAALSGGFDAVFVMPADLPLIAADDLTELIGAFKKRPAGHVLVPMVDGQRGNPILLDDEARAQILASGTNLACRHLIERQPELVHAHQTANTRFITDLDTVEDVQGLARRTGWRLELPALEAVE